MKYKYCVRRKTDKSHGEEQVKYYAVPLSSGTVGTEELSESISRRCTLSEGDIRATIVELIHTIEQELHQGKKVCLEGIGIFSLSASSDGFDTPEECTPSKVKAKRICFLADKRLKKNLKFVKFEKDKKR